ncbi:MAG: radical SAM protein [Planctomycetes bacterium]|nr:radical SAM protein [Planctomycetota bacterium]
MSHSLLSDAFQMLRPLPATEAYRLATLKPMVLGFETTNVCNADCAFCAYGRMTRPKGTMSEGTFRSALGQYTALGGGEICFTPVVGDPLLDPDLVSRIRSARAEKSIRAIELFTNLIALDRAGGPGPLLGSGLTRIGVSLGGLDGKTYETLFRRERFAQVWENLERLLTENVRGGHRVSVTVYVRALEASPGPDGEARLRRLRDLGARVVHSARYDNWGGIVAQADLPGAARFHAPKPFDGPCRELYKGLHVLWDGRVTACGCRDVNGDPDLVLGDLAREPLDAIWRGVRLATLRERFARDDRPSFCRACLKYNGFLSTYGGPDGRRALRANGRGLAPQRARDAAPR